MIEQKEKFKNIEFLRIIGCVSIILLHMFNKAHMYALFPDIDLYNKLHIMTGNGQKAVDLFFIFSGVFFCLNLNLQKNIFDFIKKKLIRLYPVLVFVILLYFLISLTGVVKFTFYDNILNLLCLNGTNLVLKLGNAGQFWYVSAMLWTMLLFYYLLKNYEEKNVNLFFALLIFFAYGVILHAKGGKINSNFQTFNYIYNIGMLRAFGGVALGYFIGKWYKTNKDIIKNFMPNLLQKLIFTLFEFLCLYFIINNLMLHKLDYKNHFLFIIAFCAIIMLFLLKKGFISNLLEKSWCEFLAKYTYSFYMTHLLILNILEGSLWKYHSGFVYSHPVINIALTSSLISFIGIFTYHIIEIPFKTILSKPKSASIEPRGGGDFDYLSRNRQ